MYVCMYVCIRGTYDKFPDFFVWAFKIDCRRFLKIRYVIAIHLMR